MATDDAHMDENEDLFNFDALDHGAAAKAPQAAAPAAARRVPVPPAPLSSTQLSPGTTAAVPRAPLPVTGKTNFHAPAQRTPSAPQGAQPLESTGVRAPLPATRAAGVARPLVPAPPLPASAKPSAPSPTAKPGAALSAEPMRPRAVELAAGPRDASPAAPEPPRRRRRALLHVLLALAVLGNFALVGIVWRSMTRMNAALERDATAAPRASDATTTTPAWPNLAVRAPARNEGELALETAAEEIRRGEYERARARLYSLLSVIDRFDAAQRANLASRAQVLAADSYREQADVLERKVAGFVEAADAAPKEQHP